MPQKGCRCVPRHSVISVKEVEGSTQAEQIDDQPATLHCLTPTPPCIRLTPTLEDYRVLELQRILEVI